jgi:hypothetical protein
MGLQLEGSFGEWDKTDPDRSGPNYLTITHSVYKVYLVIVINHLMESVCLGHKVIPLNGAHCRLRSNEFFFHTF